MDKTSLGDRMKDYEKRSAISLLPKIPMIIRLDGKSFHTYTKMFKKTNTDPPFSKDLKDAMIYAIIETCNNGVMGLQCVYQQSDEITFVVYQDGEKSQGWFDCKVQKVVSIISSIFTRKFNYFMDMICENKEHYRGKDAYFDARCFNVPNIVEAHNCLVWRQQDFKRNSVQMLGYHHFSHNSMNNLNCSQVQDRLMNEKQINWNDLDVWKKRGVLVIKKRKVKDVTYFNKKLGKEQLKENVERYEWGEVECPIFTQKSVFELIEEEKPNVVT